MSWLLLLAIRLYQATLSKLLVAVFGPVCRFEPSCSKYAAACIASHGAVRGSLLSLKRLSRCHPFHPGGYDPPPPTSTNAASSNTGATERAQPDVLEDAREAAFDPRADQSDASRA